MNDVMNTSISTRRPSPRPRVALGNNQVRYNSYVEGVKSKYMINSTRNSEEIPDWMNRTQNYYKKSQRNYRPLIHKDANVNRGLYQDKTSPFQSVRQTYIYENKPKYPHNTSGQFTGIVKKKPRSFWEMKNHTFELEWPKQEQRKTGFSSSTSKFSVNNRSYILENNPQHNLNTTTRQLKYSLPKYGIRQSPLHVQKQTPLKIGHIATVDTYSIK